MSQPALFFLIDMRSSGYVINFLESLRNMNTKISLGNKVREKFTSCVLGEYNLNEGISGVVSEYSKPATKADLTLLAYEIMKLRGTFEGRGGENRKEKGEKE